MTNAYQSPCAPAKTYSQCAPVVKRTYVQAQTCAQPVVQRQYQNSRSCTPTVCRTNRPAANIVYIPVAQKSCARAPRAPRRGLLRGLFSRITNVFRGGCRAKNNCGRGYVSYGNQRNCSYGGGYGSYGNNYGSYGGYGNSYGYSNRGGYGGGYAQGNPIDMNYVNYDGWGGITYGLGSGSRYGFGMGGGYGSYNGWGGYGGFGNNYGSYGGFGFDSYGSRSYNYGNRNGYNKYSNTFPHRSGVNEFFGSRYGIGGGRGIYSPGFGGNNSRSHGNSNNFGNFSSGSRGFGGFSVPKKNFVR